METTTEETDEYVLEDGTRVIKTIITTRVPPVFHLVEESKMTDFERAFLGKHNEYRALHAVAPLQMSRDMSDFSQEWADKCACDNKTSHPPPPHKYGLNMYHKRSTSMKITGEEVVKCWYDTGKNYDPAWYGREPPAGVWAKSGNYTQVIWKGTQRVGVGMGVNGNTFYVVATYDPPGNMQTLYKENVFALKPELESGRNSPPPPIGPT